VPPVIVFVIIIVVGLHVVLVGATTVGATTVGALPLVRGRGARGGAPATAAPPTTAAPATTASAATRATAARRWRLRALRVWASTRASGPPDRYPTPSGFSSNIASGSPASAAAIACGQLWNAGAAAAPSLCVNAKRRSRRLPLRGSVRRATDGPLLHRDTKPNYRAGSRALGAPCAPPGPPLRFVALTRCF
jgi:hypothetical protein